MAAVQKIWGSILFPAGPLGGKSLRDNGTWASPVIFAHYADATTPDTATTDLYSDTIPASTLAVNGDILRVEYAGEYAANGNDKHLTVELDGTDVFDTDAIAENDTDWTIDLTIIRVTSSAVRIKCVFNSASARLAVYTELTGMDLAAAVDLKLQGRTPDNAGDLTARLGCVTVFAQ